MAHKLLVLLLDSVLFKESQGKKLRTSVVDSIMIFIEAYLLLNRNNQLAIICFGYHHKPIFLYKSYDMTRGDTKNENGNMLKTFSIDNMVAKLGGLGSEAAEHLHLNCAAYMSLCFINKMSSEFSMLGKSLHCRQCLMVSNIHDSRDLGAFTNIGFASMQLQAPLDVCCFESSESRGSEVLLLKKYAELSHGIFTEVKSGQGKENRQSLQHLFHFYLMSLELKGELCQPYVPSVDVHGECSCPVGRRCSMKIGFICSSCLSVHCSFKYICSNCRAKIVNR